MVRGIWAGVTVISLPRFLGNWIDSVVSSSSAPHRIFTPNYTGNQRLVAPHEVTGNF